MKAARFIKAVKRLSVLSGVAVSSSLLSLPALAQLNPRPSIFNEPLYTNSPAALDGALPELTPSVPLSPRQPAPEVTPLPGTPQFPGESAPGGTPFPGSIAPEDPQVPSQTIPGETESSEQTPSPLPLDLLYPNQADPNSGSGYNPIGPDIR